MMKNKEFKELLSDLDSLDRNQIKRVIKDCVNYLIEMLSLKEEDGF